MTETDECAAVKARLAELENATTWNTSCLSCSAVLDRAATEMFRREQAEAKLAAIEVHRAAILEALAYVIQNMAYVALEKPYRAALKALDGNEEESGHGG